MTCGIANLVGRSLDRPGGRSILSTLATAYARKVLGVDARIIFDDIWIHRCNGVFWPDGERFRYYANVIQEWPSEATRIRQATRRNWLKYYEPKPGDIIVDVGAGIGAEVLLLSEAVGKEGCIYAIEAHPVTFKGLKKFCELNGLSNVAPIHAAVSSESGFLQISDGDAHEANSIVEGVVRSGAGIRVPAITLDEIVSEFRLSRVDFLKMNIEGAERQAIRGMRRSIDIIENVSVACHDFRADRGEDEGFRTRSEIDAFLRRSGFAVQKIENDLPDCIRDHVHARRADVGAS